MSGIAPVSEAWCLRTLPPSALLSPPLPVEFVAGGEGRPDLYERSDPSSGPGGSGRSGKFGGDGLLAVSPINMADNGRRLGTKPVRNVIKRKSGEGEQDHKTDPPWRN
jgi:hypothetical protein